MKSDRGGARKPPHNLGDEGLAAEQLKRIWGFQLTVCSTRVKGVINAKSVLRFYPRRVDNTWRCAGLCTAHWTRGTGTLETFQRDVIWVNLKSGREEWGEGPLMGGVKAEHTQWQHSVCQHWHGCHMAQE